MPFDNMVDDRIAAPRRRLFWLAVWLAVCLVTTKAFHLGVPRLFPLDEALAYVGSLAAISYIDTLFAGGLWVVGRAALAVAGRRVRAVRMVSNALTVAAAFFAMYSVANLVVFGVFGGFVSYPLLALVGDVRMVRSSIGSHVTPGAVAGLLGVPLVYLVAVAVTTRRTAGSMRTYRWPVVALIALAAWVALGQWTYAAKWRSRPDRRVAANAPWVFVSSWWQAATGDGVVRMPEEYPADDLSDFEPVRERPGAFSPAIRRASAALGPRAARRPPNVILVILESVGLRWTSLADGLYETTPTLAAETASSVTFPNAYAHIGRSSNSLAAILLSSYPKLDFREITEQFPDLPGTSLAAVLRDRGYETAFMTPSDLSWAGWGPFLNGRGFSEVRDYHSLSCPEMLSSWGVEDRCMVDAMVTFVQQQRTRPFFLMAWTTQTHHPYDMSPGVPELNLLKETTPDDWDLGHYLNVVHEDDHQLARVFDAVRRAGLEDDTLIVVTGDHGQAFGYPHVNSYIQGRSVYQEDVNVPLMFWFPRVYKSAVRSTTVASHVDVAPTIADLAGVPEPSDWQGRDLFDTSEPHRAYFYVAEDSFTLGVREDNWKYIYDLRDGTEELYDLDRDPTEQRNQAAHEPERCARLRQRLAAWTEANRRQYAALARAVSNGPAAP